MKAVVQTGLRICCIDHTETRMMEGSGCAYRLGLSGYLYVNREISELLQPEKL